MSEKMDEIRAKLAVKNEEHLAAAKQAAAEENPEAARKAAEDAGKLNPNRIINQESKGHIPAVTITGEKPKQATLEELGPDALNKIRIFRSRIPGSSFVMKEGYTIYFHNGWYETSDKSEIEQLDAVANKTPAIHTEEHERDIVAAIIQARKEGFQGSIADAMTQQITVEQRLQTLRSGTGPLGSSTGSSLKLPTVLPVGGAPEGLDAQTAASREAALRQAIKNASAQSNS